MPVAEIAQIQEFGTSRIPPRPFMRPAATENQAKWAETAQLAAKRVVDGKMTPHDAMELLGAVAMGDIQQAIVNVMAPPLAILTLVGRKFRQLYGRKARNLTELYALATKLGGKANSLAGVSTSL